MSGKVKDLTRKAKKMTIKEQKLEFLSLSCPRASEYVLRKKKINKKEISCQRGNAEILDEFFKILASSEIEMLKFHLLAVQPEDYEAFRKNLAKCDSYQVKWIVFNQSADPQLIIDFTVKCTNLEYFMVKGYNQKYPCNKTDYVIRVYRTSFYQNCGCSQLCQCKKVILSLAEIAKSHIPLMCKPIEWSYQEREQLLTKKIPKAMLNAGFIHNTECFFAETQIPLENDFLGSACYVSNSENRHSMYVRRSKSGVCYRVENHNLVYMLESPELSVLLEFDKPEWKLLNGSFEAPRVEKTLRMRSLFYQSDEERDLYPNQTTLMDMPMMIINKIMDNLTFSERLSFRRSCRQLYKFPGSQKHVVDLCIIDAYDVKATIEGKRFKCRVGEAKEIFAMISRNSYVKELEMTPRGLGVQRRLFKELEKIEPIRVENLIVNMNRETHEASMKFIVEKCQGALGNIALICFEHDIDFKIGDYLEKILSARKVSIYGLSFHCAMEGLKTFVERTIVSATVCRFTLNYEHRDDSISLEKFQETYPERIISTSSSPDSSTVRFRTDDPTKHILVERFSEFFDCTVIPADFVEKN